MPRKALDVEVSPRVHGMLVRLSRARSAPQRLVERASMVVLAAEGMSDVEQARRLGVNEQRPRRWRRRWRAASALLAGAEAEGATDEDLEHRIVVALSDEPRSGGPPKFTPEQVTQLVALACERPAESGLPVNRWTPAELAREAVKRGIVESISKSHLDRILKRSRSSAP